jgi:hypothetical protein
MQSPFFWPGLVVAVVMAAPGAFAGEAPPSPLPADATRTLQSRWLAKPVLDSRLLDDMEKTNAWSHHGRGEMTFTRERARDGLQAVRLLCPTKGEAPSRSGRPWGECVLRRQFAAEDWTAFNRLSFWVYPRLPGFKVISMLVKLRNDGRVKVPDGYNREGLHYFLLQPDQWNQVVWEIPHLARDKVTGVEFIYRQQGHEPGATNQVCYEVDHLELQRVTADHFEGWTVAPGRIAYSHSGYLVNAPKTALASGLRRGRFRLVDEKTSQAVLTRTAAKVATPTGEVQVFDFSSVQQAGLYRLEADELKTPPFPIGDQVWRPTVLKTINLFYAERCGTAVPGIHDFCHGDWQAAYRGTNLFIHGGWHDAGDLSQGLINTAEAAYAMLRLAETLRHQEPPLAQRLLEEARWGMAWVLKTRFGDGARVTWATMDYWTDGVPGNVDDTFGEVRNSPYDNFTAAATEALASQLLRDTDPALAARSLAAAREDWRFALEKPASPSLELAAAGTMAALELFRATAQTEYSDRAAELARIILACQQQRLTDWRRPLAGFFYTSPKKDRLLHYAHRGHEQAPVAALAGLCRALPEHPDWVEWYTAVVLHSEYLRRLSRWTEPYGMLCASVYSLDESKEERFQAQVREGIPLSERHYLRRFPVWFDFRGNSGTILSQAKALSAAARLRRNAGLLDLAQRQLQWHVGFNPFAQSLMYGEGYDYAPQYSAMSGDLVGSLPVGVQTRAQADAPYWPGANCYNYKEVWVHPSSRWLYVLSDVLAGPASPLQPEITLSGIQTGDKVTLRLTAPADSKARFTLRSSNLRLPEAPAVKQAGSIRIMVWSGRLLLPKEPWVAVARSDSDASLLIEVAGGWPAD